MFLPPKGVSVKVVPRLLKPTPVDSFDEYLALGGGGGLRAAEVLGADAVLDELEASGLRGRGGAGFPTARKWRTVRANASLYERTTVVVNAAEGEPGTFKDRAVLRNDPYQVLEGALIAARVLDADQIVIATKHSFEREVARLTTAITEVRRRGWCEGIAVDLYEGPNEYLFGEETALLETIDGRYPFPRIAPPYRRGVQEIVTSTAAVSSGSGLSARVVMAGPNGTREAPPALVNNVETLANVTWILAKGPAWFRHVGTTDSPGTMICTVTGSTRRNGVAEIPLGSSLRDVLEHVGGGARPGRRTRGVLPGVANALVTDDLLDTPVSYEAFTSIGSGLGSAGFIVFDDHDDVVALVAGASHFLSVESCGQCTPC
jgi:NADH:ubiquinone oxidoreductase subunit F (NADH-binding)